VPREEWIPHNKHIVTSETREAVKAMSAFGLTQEQMATYYDISHDTLHRHYSDELRTSLVDANLLVANKLFRQATDNENVTAMIFWLKCRAGWKEPEKIEAKAKHDELLDEIKAIRADNAIKHDKDY